MNEEVVYCSGRGEEHLSIITGGIGGHSEVSMIRYGGVAVVLFMKSMFTSSTADVVKGQRERS
jgi:hypothetical protein